ncbi:MAG TPA: peptidyl-prolyl cis-trans isomerase [Thermoleophilia bacterium]|nr:peptidyl-prolyl cis-trans isomerase [Thermoleophilia bacterium]
MKRLALVALALALGLALLVAAGCGGGKVPQGAIATVGGVPITKAQFDQYINQAKASAGQNGQPAFPSPGTTTYNRYAAEIVNYLVEQQVVLNAAAKDKVTVTDAQVQSQLQAIAAQYGGTQKMYAAAQKAGMNAAQLKTYIKNSLAGQKLYQKIIGNVAPTTAQMQTYYNANKSQFDQPATRTVRHVLVKTKAEALKVQALLAADNTTANWVKVAKKYSTDTGTKSSGGNLGPIHKGQMVKPFEDAAFAAKLDTVSAPVHSQYGWHVLEVTKITPAKKSTFASAKASIKSTLTSQMQSNTWKNWLAKEQKAATILYAAGFDPDKLTASPSPAPSASSSK